MGARGEAVLRLIAALPFCFDGAEWGGSDWNAELDAQSVCRLVVGGSGSQAVSQSVSQSVFSLHSALAELAGFVSQSLIHSVSCV